MKKAYDKPRVSSENVLEQTSLACTQTADPDEVNFTDSCEVNVTKGGNYFPDCESQVLDAETCSAYAGTILS